MRARSATLIIASALLGFGCARPTGKGIVDDDASFKIPAIKAAVREQDRSAVGQLVKDLENDDPAIRLYAIEGLRRLTGKTFDYRYFHEPEDRAPAVRRWQQWLAEQER